MTPALNLALNDLRDQWLHVDLGRAGLLVFFIMNILMWIVKENNIINTHAPTHQNEELLLFVIFASNLFQK